jgi:hypothetical protein
MLLELTVKGHNGQNKGTAKTTTIGINAGQRADHSKKTPLALVTGSTMDIVKPHSRK